MTSATVSDFIYSSLADDPVLGEIVRCYVDEMPRRVAGLQIAFESNDRNGLATFAHQIRGSAGSHGFHPLTDCAAALEQLSRGQAVDEEIRQALDALIDVCSRVRYR